MNFIKYNPLKEQLRNRTMSDRDALPYYIVQIAFMSLFLFPIPYEHTYSFGYVFSSIVVTAVTIAGILYCYVKNGGRTGYDFIQKTIVLGWVVVVRVFLLFFYCLFIFIMTYGVILHRLKIKPVHHSCPLWIGTIVTVVIAAIYFQRLGRHIKDTQKEPGDPAGSGYRPPAAGSA